MYFYNYNNFFKKSQTIGQPASHLLHRGTTYFLTSSQRLLSIRFLALRLLVYMYKDKPLSFVFFMQAKHTVSRVSLFEQPFLYKKKLIHRNINKNKTYSL